MEFKKRNLLLSGKTKEMLKNIFDKRVENQRINSETFALMQNTEIDLVWLVKTGEEPFENLLNIQAEIKLFILMHDFEKKKTLEFDKKLLKALKLESQANRELVKDIKKNPSYGNPKERKAWDLVLNIYFNKSLPDFPDNN